MFISSISASAGSYDEIYSASKSALLWLTKSLAKNTKNGVRFNCVSPGLIKIHGCMTLLIKMRYKLTYYKHLLSN